ncbi:1082_t:CDS:1 [Ambispora gerdemannii]|uniref:1082_t:CDS:1 n=1 Tax=Ambispora gerdemannii TaxID=144530 RepID=A0A9N9A4U4_9GLOM|nr:1082_t:CDS:1 [Ambispora gerdemannii]
MNKQTSHMFFLVTLIFIFVSSSSANAIPKGIEKRFPCPQLVDVCTFVPNTLDSEIGGDIKFQQNVDCSVTIFGVLNFLPSDLDTINYQVHIIQSRSIIEPIVELDVFLTPQINAPFITTVTPYLIDKRDNLHLNFLDLDNYICAVSHSGVILGTAPIDTAP